MHNLFVYGTLKKGFPNFLLNDGVLVDGTFRTVELFSLYLTKDRNSPVLFYDSNNGRKIKGQLFLITGDTLSAIDILERVEDKMGYLRKEIDVVDDEGIQIRAFCYIKDSKYFIPEDIHSGPLESYEIEHAKLYKSRSCL